MKKIYLEFIRNKYGMTKIDLVNCHTELYNTHLALNPWEADVLGVIIDSTSTQDRVCIYSEDSYKKQAKLEFETEEEQNLFDDQYVAYCDKRWSEMPKVIMSIQDWEELQVKWEKIKNEKPEYVIFTLNNSGALDKVDVYGKNELTEEDKAYIKQEHEKFLKYERARQKYIDNHPDYSDVWRGLQDDEYEADIMKYYEV